MRKCPILDLALRLDKELFVSPLPRDGYAIKPALGFILSEFKETF